MSWFDSYSNRMNAIGSDTKEYLAKTAKDSNARSFKDSPFYEIVNINGVATDVRVLDDTVTVNGKSFYNKFLNFRPDTSFDVGSLVEYDAKNWYIMDFNNNDIFPTASIKLCNSNFPLTTTTKTLAGYDDFGKPVYSESETVTYTPCIAETKIYIADSKQPINLPENKIIITIKYIEHEDIKINNEFKIYDQSYKIIMIDKTQSDVINKTGILVIHAEMEVNNA